MPENPLNLVSLAEAKAYLNISVTTFDTQIQAMIDGASALIEDFCQNAMVEREFTEHYTGGINLHKGGAKRIYLKHFPVAEVASITDDSGYVMPADQYVIWPEKGILEHFGYWYVPQTTTGSPGRWTVVYTAGRHADTASVIPSLKLACNMLLATRWMARSPGIQSQRIGDLSIAWDRNLESEGLPAEVRSMLGPYVAISV